MISFTLTVSHTRRKLVTRRETIGRTSRYGTFVEYFGLKGDPGYDKKTRLKQKLCNKYGIKLVSIYPKDLASSKKLEEKLLTNLCG